MWQQVDIKPPIDNQIIDFSIGGEDFLVTSVDGELFATKDLCPHEEIKISLGCIKHSRLKCSLHGFSFNLKTGKCDNPEVENLQTYPVKMENNNILIDL